MEPLDTDSPPSDEPDANDEAPAPAPRDSTHRPRDRSAYSADEHARIAREAGRAQALMLGAVADSGWVTSLLENGATTGSSAEVLRDAQGVAISSGNAFRPRDGGGGSGEQDGLATLDASNHGRGAREGTDVVEVTVSGRVHFDEPEEVGGSGVFDASEVVAMIRARQSAFRRCYETSLGRNPTVAGRVTVGFTIEPRGNVSGARATENTTDDAPLGTCVAGVISRLRWAHGPEGGNVQFSYPFIFAPQN